MPSVEYPETALVWEEGSKTIEHPDTGEIIERTDKVTKHAFEVRISKWLGRDGLYHLHGFVRITEFGQTLASESDPWTWVLGNYSVADGATEMMVEEMVAGVRAVKNARLDTILDVANVSPVSSEVVSAESGRFDFHIVLDGAETFDIDWLTVDFDPRRGGE